MTPERWREIEELYYAAAESDPASREQILAQADPALRREVESLLEHEGTLFDRPAWDNTGAGPQLPEPSPINQIFATDALIADRFRIVRPLGQGGMGMVYEAVDEKLDRRVALKCAKPQHRNRLPPEARAAREVSHFNVCKVYDLHNVATAEGDADFLSMEFIEGEPLSARLRRTGALPLAEARDIALQVCAGLAQAHRQGVIHGDLKCGNVLLAKTADGGTRVVITDFGLARMSIGDAAGEGPGGGTLEYMAPELFLGQRASIASDIYALGVMLHVMLTAAPPKNADESFTTPTRSLTNARFESAEGQRELAGLPRPWKQIVTRCLAAKPDRRFDSAEQVMAAFQPRRLLAKSAAALVATAGLAFGYWRLQAPVAETPVRLAILPFASDGDSLPGIAGVANDLADRLSGARRNFVVISARENQNQRVDSAEKARRIVGATHALETRINVSAGRVTATAALTDVASGQRIGPSLSGVYSAADPAALAKALIATVTQAFRLRSGVPQETVSAAAYADYSQAIELLRRDSNNATQAIPLLERAIDKDARSALPYAGLAEAQLLRFAGGEGAEWLDRALANVAKANSLNADSVPVLLASGLAEQQRGQYERAARDYTRATELNPNNSDAWRRLAIVYEATNRPEEAIATYRKAIAAQPDYYRQYLQFGTFYLNRNDFPQAEDQYRHVTKIAPELADGHMNLGLALMRQRRFSEAEQSLGEALRLRRTPLLLSNLGSLYYAQERFAEAAPLYEECATAQPSALRYRNLGDAYRHLGKAADAKRAYQAAYKLAEQEVARNPRQASTRARLAIVSAYLGERARAESELAQALSLEPESAGVLRDSAIVYEFLGRLDNAIAVLENAPKFLLEDLAHQPDTRRLQNDARFKDLVRRKSAQ
jgi:serine/threonine protein kinase/tetratricopeptide (TPR) repeat protein